MKYPENDDPSTGLHLILMIVMFVLIILLGFATVSMEGKEPLRSTTHLEYQSPP